MKERVRIVEVGPRDGLQNEPAVLPLASKLRLIELLTASGLRHIEVASFVKPERMPQMADSVELLRQLNRQPGIEYSALVPNAFGLKQALDVRPERIAVFTTTSETFCQKNINCSIAESYQRFAELIPAAQAAGMPVRGYLSCIHRCPYEGAMPVASVVAGCEKLLALGCDEISLGDTIGTCTPFEAKILLGILARAFGPQRLALHFHNTYGQALANLYVGMELGYRSIDASIAGLGGCPYAKGATGNLATEDVVYMLENSGFDTGVDLDALLHASAYVTEQLKRPAQSAVARARL